MNAPTGRNTSVRVSERAIAASDLPKSFAIAVSVMTTRKKSNASRVQPRKPAATAARRSELLVAVIGARVAGPLDYLRSSILTNSEGGMRVGVVVCLVSLAASLAAQSPAPRPALVVVNLRFDGEHANVLQPGDTAIVAAATSKLLA